MASKSIKMIKDRQIIKEWLVTNGVRCFTILPDNSVNVNGHVFLDGIPIEEFPFQWNIITSYFSCENCGLKSLKGFPRHITSALYIRENNFKLSLSKIKKNINKVCKVNYFFI